MDKKMTTQAAYAKQRGVSPQYISKLCKDGVITLQDGKINPDTADRAIEDWSSRIHDTPGKKGTNVVEDDSIAGHRKRQIKVVTALKQLELDTETGLLINVDELRSELARLFVDVKTRLRAIPSKSTGEVWHTVKAAKSQHEAMAKVSTLLLREIDEALTELSQWQHKPNKKGGATAGKKKGAYKQRKGA